MSSPRGIEVGSIRNTAIVSAAEDDSDPSNNSAELTTKVKAPRHGKPPSNKIPIWVPDIRQVGLGLNL